MTLMVSETNLSGTADVPGGTDLLWKSVAERWVEAIEAFTLWKLAQGARQGTIDQRRYQLMRFAEEHLHVSPWKIKLDDLVAWLAKYEWDASTRRGYRSALCTFYSWANLTGRARSDPSVQLPRVKVPPAPPRPAPDGVLERALAGASVRDRLLVQCEAYAGMRRAEVAAFRWDWRVELILDDGPVPAIRVEGKGGRVRVVPEHPILKSALDAEWVRRLVGDCGSGWRYTAGLDVYVFPGQRGGPMRPDVVGKITSRLLGPGWSGHTLRHRFATRAYAATGDLLALQELLGHSKPETTKRYTQVSRMALFDAVAAV